MNPLTLAILTVILRQPAWQGDEKESEADRRSLLLPVASAIADATTDSADVAALVTLGWHESHFARYVVEGRCLSGPPGVRCDERNGKATARGPWQVHGWCRAAWKHPDGSVESLREGAKCALQMLAWARVECGRKGLGNGWLGAFAGYRSRRCDKLDAPMRVATFRRISAELREEIQGSVVLVSGKGGH